MLDRLITFHWSIFALLFVGAFILAALFGLYLTRKFVPQKVLKASHDVAGYTFGIIGVIYAVILGFIVVEVNNRFHEAEQRALEETATLIELFRDLAVFPYPFKIATAEKIRDYTRSVISDEWVKMQNEEESLKARDDYLQLWNLYRNFSPSNDLEKIWYTESLNKLNELSHHRVLRLFNMRPTMSSMMWAMLYFGAFVTIFFMCFFSAENHTLQAVMMVLLTATIAFILCLIINLEGIYTGTVRVNGEEFIHALQHFEESIMQFKSKTGG